MNVKWLVENDAFPEDTTPLLDALKRQGIEHKIIEQKPCEKTEFLHLFPFEDCVIFYGSLGLAKKIRKQATWIPGVYYDVPKYDCVAYYAALGKYLLNGNYVMLPFGELLRQKEYLFEKVGVDRAVFIRPNRGDKIFTGQLVLKENYEKDVDLFGFGNITPEELVVVAEPRNIRKEWRFVVVEGKVVTGSQYKENDRFAPEVTFDSEAFRLASEIATKYNPDIAWVIDICRTASGYYLMEAGCLSCAGLYCCDRDTVIETVSAAALKEWNSYFERI